MGIAAGCRRSLQDCPAGFDSRCLHHFPIVQWQDIRLLTGESTFESWSGSQFSMIPKKLQTFSDKIMRPGKPRATSFLGFRLSSPSSSERILGLQPGGAGSNPAGDAGSIHP
jgi:hypothetical protein